MKKTGRSRSVLTESKVREIISFYMKYHANADADTNSFKINSLILVLII